MGRKLSAAAWVMALALAAISPACTEKGADMKAGGKAKGRIVTVDSTGDAGYHVAMDLDSQEAIHLVYYDKANQSLKYVRHSEAGFSAETVDDTCKSCLYATIRVTGDYAPHVAYYSDATQTLTYAYRRDGKWKREGIEWGRGTGMGVQLQFDDEGGLHALYYSGDGYLKHAWRLPNPDFGKPPKKKARKRKGAKADEPPAEVPEGLWGNDRVDRANGSEKVLIRFIKQPNGRFAASYFHWSGLSSEVRIATQGPDGSWTTEVVAHEHSPGKSSALFFNRDGDPQVIFRQALKDRLAIAGMTAQGWKTEPLVPQAYNMSVAIDATFNILLAYERMSGRDPRKGHLRMALRRDWVWTDYEIDSAPGSGTYLAAGLTAAGKPIVAYFSESSKSLKLFLGE